MRSRMGERSGRTKWGRRLGWTKWGRRVNEVGQKGERSGECCEEARGIQWEACPLVRGMGRCGGDGFGGDGHLIITLPAAVVPAAVAVAAACSPEPPSLTARPAALTLLLAPLRAS